MLHRVPRVRIRFFRVLHAVAFLAPMGDVEVPFGEGVYWFHSTCYSGLRRLAPDSIGLPRLSKLTLALCAYILFVSKAGVIEKGSVSLISIFCSFACGDI
ncbi:hypothetical protein FA13DRAFT_394987 [Coprinellus micaceus]|uniref:Uncharacterized protein n=1 Tax=Coprinellus micaceus TaxID=71717 RepID=A0A4Y7TXI5_COPMI|nr:hypothetical protein FA13DRAFT_394987 [Coprinellus micaceus]